MKIEGFTPVFDSLVKKYNQSVAVTYGKIWRYCMWSDMGRCTASNARLANETGYDEKTIRRAKEILAKDNLIERHFNVGKTDICYVKHELALEIRGPDIVSTDLGHDVHTTPDIVSTKDRVRDSKDIKQNYADAIKDGAKLASTIRAHFQEHLGLTPNWDTKTNQAHYLFFRERYQEGQTVKEFADWWRSDWKGRDGGMPSSLNQVQTLWMQAFTQTTNDLEAENERLKELHG